SGDLLYLLVGKSAVRPLQNQSEWKGGDLIIVWHCMECHAICNSTVRIFEGNSEGIRSLDEYLQAKAAALVESMMLKRQIQGLDEDT
ncbi:hypothetical protein A1F96_11292, partial [Pyrenophora tritici-repentis]